MSFGVCDQARLKLACSASEASYSLGIFSIKSVGTILSMERIIKMLIRLG